MPNIKDLLESEYISVDFVQNSPTKKAVIINGGTKEMDDYKHMKLTMLVDIDGKQRKYRPNRISLDRLSKAWGFNSDSWAGNQISFSIGLINGKDVVIADPTVTPTETVQPTTQPK